MDDIAFVLDEERRESRRKLMEALALEDEAAAIKGVLAVSAQIDEAFATWRAFESESREEKLAAHARLPFYKRPFDLDKDGTVSFQEKRFLVTITLLIMTTIACVVLVGLLTKHFVDSRINPLTTAEFNESEQITLPRMSFCIEGPAFVSNPGRPGPPLFNVDFWKPPAEAGVADRDRPPLPVESTVLAELPGSIAECSSASATLSSTVNPLDCVFCYELTRDVTIRKGDTAEENVRSDLQLQFKSYEPFVECLTRNVLSTGTKLALAGLITTNWGDLITAQVLQGASPTVTTPVGSMDDEQRCNTVFFSDYFYPRRAGETPVSYLLTAAGLWTPTGQVYNNPNQLAAFSLGVEIHILDFSSRSNTQAAHDHRSIPGFPVGNARANLLTQVLLSKRTISHRIREGRQTTRSEDLYRAKVDYYPRVFQEAPAGINYFFLSIAIDSFIVESYSNQPTYTVPMFLEQLVRGVRALLRGGDEEGRRVGG